MRKNIFSQSLRELSNLRSLTLASLLAAIYAVSNSPVAGNIVIVPGAIEIRFGFLAIAVCAMLFGPVPAAIAAIIGDVVGIILFYGGAFFWGYTLSWALMGLMFGCFFYKERISLPRIVGAMLGRTLFINLLLTTYWQEKMGIGTFLPLLIKRLPLNLIMFPINILLTYWLLKGVRGAYRKMRHAV